MSATGKAEVFLKIPANEQENLLGKMHIDSIIQLLENLSPEDRSKAVLYGFKWEKFNQLIKVVCL